ncbi:MAG TPA: C40 family peptidase [Gammaproteobacteria bacterium]|nr:C40 family peptidase [Gammaproteobacteria bacterium]
MRNPTPRLLSLFPALLLLGACAQWPEAVPAVSAPPGGTTTSVTGQGGTGDAIAKLAEQQLGVPYVYGGHTPQGFDCSGLVYYVYGQAGRPVPRTAEAQFARLPHIERGDLEPGDLVFFRSESSQSGMHVGIYVGSHWFVHASESGKPVASARLDSDYWAGRYLGAARPP